MVEEQAPDEMAGMVVQDLAEQVASISVDRAAWRARAVVAERALAEMAEENTEEEEDG